MLQDAKTLLKVRRHFNKMAIVNSLGWKQRLTRISSPFVQGEWRTFNVEDEDKAWQGVAD